MFVCFLASLLACFLACTVRRLKSPGTAFIKAQGSQVGVAISTCPICGSMLAANTFWILLSWVANATMSWSTWAPYGQQLVFPKRTPKGDGYCQKLIFGKVFQQDTNSHRPNCGCFPSGQPFQHLGTGYPGTGSWLPFVWRTSFDLSQPVAPSQPLPWMEKPLRFHC